MVRKSEEENDLFKLAAQAGKEESAQDGISLDPIFLGPEQRGINQEGDDPGFETRVKPPARRGRPRKTDDGEATKKPVRPRSSASERTAAEISEALQSKFDEFFAVVSIGMPVTGIYGIENSEKAVKALMSIGKRRPKLMQALMRVADGADGIDVGRYVLGLIFAVQVDMQRLPYDSIPAKATGVTAIVEKHFMSDGESAQNPGMTTQETTSGRFTPVV